MVPCTRDLSYDTCVIKVALGHDLPLFFPFVVVHSKTSAHAKGVINMHCCDVSSQHLCVVAARDDPPTNWLSSAMHACFHTRR